MASKTDVGHKNNVANLETFNIEIESFGTTYNPSQASIKLANLKVLQTNAQNVLSAYATAEPPATNARTARAIAFKPLDKLVRRIVNSVKASGAPKETIGNVQTIARELLGVRKTPKLTEEQKNTLKAEGKEVKREREDSQKNFDSRIANFERLIKLLGSIPQYTPNENDLKIVTLNTTLADLKTKNTAVQKAEAIESNAIDARDELLYKATTGLVDITVAAKNYVKSVYGATSQQYKRVSKIKFKKINR